MKNKCSVALVLTVFVSIFSISAVPVYADTGNQVRVELSYQNNSGTDGDSLENIPVVWSTGWFTNMINTPDGSGLPVYNPKVELKTNLNLVNFYPNDPLVFTAQPDLGIYTWDFNGLNLLEKFHLPLYAKTSDDTQIAKPRFSASRSVVPETLTNESTEQTVTLNLKFEEPFSPEINNVHIAMGASKIAYEQYSLVEGQFISMTPVTGWNIKLDGIQAEWNTNPSNIEIGKTYIFQAILRSVKSSDLKGSPIFKPGIGIDYSRNINEPMVTSNSVTITFPDNSISASFSADNEVDWYPYYQDNWYHFGFQPIVSEITPPPPPFHVLIPAIVQIKPETLQLKSKGVMTAYVQLPEQYRIEDINISTVTLQGAPAVRGNIEGNTLVLKFDRQKLQNIVTGGEIELLLSGQLTDGSIFKGTDAIRVIN
jgi:hypothetical protein